MRIVFGAVQLLAAALTAGLLMTLAASEARACDDCRPQICPRQKGEFVLDGFTTTPGGGMTNCHYVRPQRTVEPAPPPTTANDRLAAQSASYCAQYPWASQ